MTAAWDWKVHQSSPITINKRNQAGNSNVSIDQRKYKTRNLDLIMSMKNKSNFLWISDYISVTSSFMDTRVSGKKIIKYWFSPWQFVHGCVYIWQATKKSFRICRESCDPGNTFLEIQRKFWKIQRKIGIEFVLSTASYQLFSRSPA